MSKPAIAKSNGHFVAATLSPATPAALGKPAAPKPSGPAAKAAALKAKPARAAPKAATKPAPKPAPKPAAKAAARAVPKTAAGKTAKPAVKAAPKPALKLAAKPAAKAARTVAKPAAKRLPKSAVPAEKAREKVHRTTLVRDSFTMPEQEYAVLGQVKKACLKAGFDVKKSELLRIGVALISQIDLATLQSVLSSLPQLKTGRPRST
ncbi:MAG: hypothetical protein Q8R69_24185 [Telluria sp.]|nr:hypothetical protein [Telluria sp.]